MHLIHHLPEYIREYGPPANFWMFPYERLNKTYGKCITNTRFPELSAVKKMEVIEYKITPMCTICLMRTKV